MNSTYFCIVCFYNKEMTGKFSVDFIFRDMKLANQTLKEYIETIELSSSDLERRCWPVLYVATISSIDEDEHYVYLDDVKKRLYISAYELDNSPFNGRRITLPVLSKTIPTEFIV